MWAVRYAGEYPVVNPSGIYLDLQDFLFFIDKQLFGNGDIFIGQLLDAIHGFFLLVLCYFFILFSFF